MWISFVNHLLVEHAMLLSQMAFSKQAEMKKIIFLNYQVECMGEVYDAEVSLAAPFDPKNLRVKGIYEDAA